MIEIIIWIIVLAFAIALLVKSSDYFVDYASKIGLAMQIPQFIIGATVVAIGTSLPELLTSIIAVLQGETTFVAGNVVGSNISNIGLILGLACVIGGGLKLKRNILAKDLPLALISTVLVLIVVWDSTVSLLDAFILFIPFLIILRFLLQQKNTAVTKTEKLNPLWFGIIFLCGFGIYLGSKFTVDSVIALTQMLPFISDTSIIALTVVALGTSLPELSVSLAAVKQKNADIAVGNILGSNIFNSLMVLSVPAFITPLIISQTVLFIAIPVMILLTVLLFIFLETHKKLSKVEGYILLLIYVIYVISTFIF